MSGSTSVQATVPVAVADHLGTLARERGTSVSAVIRDALVSWTGNRDGDFFGVRWQLADSDSWTPLAIDSPRIEVSPSGALLFLTHLGTPQIVCAPGRWSEVSRRSAVDRPLFTRTNP